jgi:hypothetical protein
MKTTTALFALSLLVLSGTAQAHPGHAGSHEVPVYGVSWMGIAPKSGTPIAPGSTPDFWKKAFVSKFRISGFAPFVSGF